MSSNFNLVTRRQNGEKWEEAKSLIAIRKTLEVTTLPDEYFFDLPDHILSFFITILSEAKCYFVNNIFIPALIQSLAVTKSKIFLDVAQATILRTENE